MGKSIKTYKKNLQFLVPYSHLFIISVLLSVVIVLLDGTSLWFIGSLVKTLFIPDTLEIAKPALSIQNINQLLKYYTFYWIHSFKAWSPLSIVCILIVVSFTLKNLLIYGNQLLLLLLNLKIVRDIRTRFYEHMLLLPVSYFDRVRSGSIVSLIVNDITQINNAMTSTLSLLFTEPLRLIFFIGLLCVLNLKLTIVIFVIYPIFIWGIVAIGKAVKRRSRRTLDTFSGMLSILSETIGCVRIVKMFNTHFKESDKFKKENSKFIKNTFRSERLRMIISPFTETLGMYAVALLLWYGGHDVLAGTASFTAEDFIRFLVFLFSSYQPIKSLGNVNSTIQGGIAAAERVFEVLELSTESLIPSSQSKYIDFKQSLSFKDVTFMYPGANSQVLTDISFSVPKGSVCAIVGSSGAGKSTILDLLPRFYEIDKGTISIDDTDIRRCDLQRLRNMFGIVSQETVLFHDTIGNNISYGLANATTEQIIQAAEAAQAMEFICHLPQGMDTLIGERGITLSGGQRQRLSIARALLRNPQILILDEATSSLDTESEMLVQKAINLLIKNRTVLVVAHRLSTIQHADTILVLEHGKIVESGSHEFLMKLSGRYRYFYEMQFNVQSSR